MAFTHYKHAFCCHHKQTLTVTDFSEADEEPSRVQLMHLHKDRALLVDQPVSPCCMVDTYTGTMFHVRHHGTHIHRHHVPRQTSWYTHTQAKCSTSDIMVHTYTGTMLHVRHHGTHIHKHHVPCQASWYTHTQAPCSMSDISQTGCSIQLLVVAWNSRNFVGHNNEDALHRFQLGFV